MALFIAKICEAPVRTTASTRNYIEARTLGVPTKIVTKPEETGRSYWTNTHKQAEVLESIVVYKIIRVHLTEGSVHQHKKPTDKLK